MPPTPGTPEFETWAKQQHERIHTEGARLDDEAARALRISKTLRHIRGRERARHDRKPLLKQLIAEVRGYWRRQDLLTRAAHEPIKHVQQHVLPHYRTLAKHERELHANMRRHEERLKLKR